MKILIASFNVGAGHSQAAKAIQQALNQKHRNIAVSTLDMLRYLPWVNRILFSSVYLSIIRHCPELWAVIFKKTDNPLFWRHSKWGYALTRMTRRRLSRDIHAMSPDVIVCTHFMELELLAREYCMPKKRALACVITDFEAHSCWLNPNVNRYFVSNERVRRSLASRGIRVERVAATGIPINPLFARETPRQAALERFGLNTGSPVVAVLGGGLGLGPVEKAMHELDRHPRPLQIICAVGKNDKLRSRLAGIPRKQRTVILGFLDNMHELLQAADAIVTKPGGLTTSEALASGCPMILINSISGQEAANSDYLLEHGAAAKVNRIADIQPVMEEVLERRLAVMKAACLQLGKPRAAFDIAGALANLAAAANGPGGLLEPGDQTFEPAGRLAKSILNGNKDSLEKANIS